MDAISIIFNNLNFMLKRYELVETKKPPKKPGMLSPRLSEYIKQKVLILFSFSRISVHLKPRGERLTFAATVPKKTK